MEPIQGPESDPDKTDTLPVLEESAIAAPQRAVFPRSPAIDLPQLAETVRTVEERIARQDAEYEALLRAFERSQDTEAAAVERGNALAAELQAVRSTLEAERERVREFERSLAERDHAVELARARTEDAMREATRLHEEGRQLRDGLASRDATIVQVLHSLGERDSQLSNLQREHAKVVPAIETQAKTAHQLDAELQSARGRLEELSRELAVSQETLSVTAAQLRSHDAELQVNRQELALAQAQSVAYLERLRTREWRMGHELNRSRDRDLARNAAQNEVIQQLSANLASSAEALKQQADMQRQTERLRQELQSRKTAADAEVARLTALLAQRETAVAEARAAAAEELRVARQQLAEAQHSSGEQAAKIQALQAEADTVQEEMTVLLAHLHEARKPAQNIDEQVRRLTGELAGANARIKALEEQLRAQQVELERTRGALAEREFLIRRLERSESSNANALGRIQTTIERLGNAPTIADSRPQTDYAATLTRIGGTEPEVHRIGRRTRIGRAVDCDLRIDSSAISRNHAVILSGPRGTIVQDVESTNGVFVNDVKVMRQLLEDGDTVAFGDIKFRYALLKPEPAEGPAAPPPDAPNG